jgi:hypothetical protein
LGVLQQHPLDQVFIPPIVVYRNEDEVRDWVEQVEAQERRIAEQVEMIHAATDEGEKRSLMNQFAPMTRRACSYPTECSCVALCYGSEDARLDPLSTGKYKPRKVNHPMELVQIGNAAGVSHGRGQ